jgi:hypothetical protein
VPVEINPGKMLFVRAQALKYSGPAFGRDFGVLICWMTSAGIAMSGSDRRTLLMSAFT